ncbi:MAG TPA: ATP-dependent helicase, partial [Bacteroidales bacterium]|nr:ATP-dependent helicase [Bacteroidales bacterium]
DDRLSAMALALGKNFRDSKKEKVKKEVVTAIYSYAVNTLCSLSEAILHVRYGNMEKEDEQVKQYVEEDRKLIAPVIKKYIDYKKERRYIDYDDMLSVVATQLERDEALRDAVTKRYRHVLVDEMQDTNPLQYKLLKSFVKGSHLFCVGDDAQSIYAFRGADFRTIHSFTEIIPHSEKLKLLLNYRSTQEILDLSNWALGQSPLRYDKKLEAHRGKGEMPSLIHVEDDWEEADLITDGILDHVAEGGRYADTMVLGRSVWSLSKVEGACLSKKIPYVKYGGTSLMQSAHVRDVASAMRIVANSYDEIAWIRFLQLWDGIGEIKASRIISRVITLATFAEMIASLQQFDGMEINAAIPATLAAVREYNDRPAQAMEAAVKAMQPMLEKKYREEWTSRASDFEVLREVARSSGSITEFITEYVLDPKAETTFKIGAKETEDAVVLSTIHSAKGLEAEIVHILNINPASYPSSRTILQGEDAIEEERRCLYVALTRAKNSLKLYRNIRSLHTQYTDANQHEQLYFLNNLPSQLVRIVINGQEKRDLPTPFKPTQGQADFPDFDFG